MTHELEIYPVMDDPDRQQYREVHPNLIKPPFRMALVGSSKSGKCLSPNGKILLTTGEIKLGDVKIGDMVFTKEGFCKVLDVIHTEGKVVYDVFFTENFKVVCSEDHKIDTTNGLKRLKDLTSKDVIITSSDNQVKLVGYNNPRKEMTMDIEVDNASHTFYYNNVSVSNSNLLMNMCRSDFYGGDKKKGITPCFTRTVVISPNLGLDSTTRSLNKLCKDGDIRTTYSDAFIYDLIESQKEKEGNDRDRIFLIIDDLLGLGCKQNCLLFSSVSYMRHLDISCCFITQQLKGQNSLAPAVRNNLDAMIFFKNGSHKQVEALCDDLQGTFGSKKNVEKMLYYATRKPYHFCFFNVRDLKVFHNFTEFMWEKYDPISGEYNDDFVVPADVDLEDTEDEE